MTKLFSIRVSTLNLLCAALMIALLVLQFTPFFTCAESGETVSLQSYVWFPYDHTDLEKEIKVSLPDHEVSELVPMALLVLLCGAAGAVVSLIKPDRIYGPLLAVICGLSGVIGYLSVPALQLGGSWHWHLILSALIAVLGVWALICAVKELQQSA